MLQVKRQIENYEGKRADNHKKLNLAYLMHVEEMYVPHCLDLSAIFKGLCPSIAYSHFITN